MVEETSLTSVFLSEDGYRKWSERSSSKDIKSRKTAERQATFGNKEKTGGAPTSKSSQHSRGTKATPSRSHSRNFTPSPCNLLSCILFFLFSLEWHFVETLSHLAVNRSPETAKLLQNWQGPCCGIFQKLQGKRDRQTTPPPISKCILTERK